MVMLGDETVVVHYHDYLDDSVKFALGDSPWDDWARKTNRV